MTYYETLPWIFSQCVSILKYLAFWGDKITEFGDLKYINILFFTNEIGIFTIYFSFNGLIHTARNDQWFIHLHNKVIYFPTQYYLLLLVEYGAKDFKYYKVLYK